MVRYREMTGCRLQYVGVMERLKLNELRCGCPYEEDMNYVGLANDIHVQRTSSDRSTRFSVTISNRASN